jgi:DHA1 family bicyclomycin/chloramphenicol resistance-like MFS transporter
MLVRPSSPLNLPEFVALIGMMMAMAAFSIDSMLPAMAEISAELTPTIPNRAQLIVTSFVLGMGLGSLFTGPLSDAFGRKPVILGGAAIFIIGSVLAWAAGSLELVLAARVLQGLGVAGPRIVILAIVRDLYTGRQMARVMSFAMIVFALVPAIAPLAGAGIMWLVGWRGIFLAFVVFALISGSWLARRQPETLALQDRRPFRVGAIVAGIGEVFAIRRVVLVIAALSLVFAILFIAISTTQQVFDQSFGRAAEFPYWFGAIALISGAASLLNARVVVQLGMRPVVAAALFSEVVLSAIMTIAITSGVLGDAIYFPAYLLWLLSIFFVAGLTIGNLNALGMEPLGHMAGLGASIIGSASTVAAVAIAIPIGFAFDGTPLPLAIGVLICAALGLFFTLFIEDLPA